MLGEERTSLALARNVRLESSASPACAAAQALIQPAEQRQGRADYIERERRTALFARSANTAIERVFILIMVSPVLVLNPGEIDRLFA